MLFSVLAMLLVLNIDTPINCQVADPCDTCDSWAHMYLSGSVLVRSVHWQQCHRRCIDPFDAQDHCHLEPQSLGDNSSRHPFYCPVGYTLPWYGVIFLSTLDDP
jgi:hypothetical protein